MDLLIYLQKCFPQLWVESKGTSILLVKISKSFKKTNYKFMSSLENRMIIRPLSLILIILSQFHPNATSTTKILLINNPSINLSMLLLQWNLLTSLDSSHITTTLITLTGHLYVLMTLGNNYTLFLQMGSPTCTR